MRFWKQKQKHQTPAPDTGQVQPAKATRRRSPPVAMEVKLLAIEALEAGAHKKDVAKVIGVGPGTLNPYCPPVAPDHVVDSRHRHPFRFPSRLPAPKQRRTPSTLRPGTHVASD